MSIEMISAVEDILPCLSLGCVTHPDETVVHSAECVSYRHRAAKSLVHSAIVPTFVWVVMCGGAIEGVSTTITGGKEIGNALAGETLPWEKKAHDHYSAGDLWEMFKEKVGNLS